MRAVLTLAAGYVTSAAIDNPITRPLRRWYYGFKLRLLTSEMYDVCDDIADAKHDADALTRQGCYGEADDRWLDAQALTTFYTTLSVECDRLHRLLDQLRP